MQALIHVHILPQGYGFTLRAGLFKSVVGWQTCAAAKLGFKNVDGLSRAEAEKLAVKLDAWLDSQMTDRDKAAAGKAVKIGPRKAKWLALEGKYREAMKP